MKKCIDWIENGVKSYPEVKSWLWFVVLWFFGLFSVLAITYPIKILIKTIS